MVLMLHVLYFYSSQYFFYSFIFERRALKEFKSNGFFPPAAAVVDVVVVVAVVVVVVTDGTGNEPTTAVDGLLGVKVDDVLLLAARRARRDAIDKLGPVVEEDVLLLSFVVVKLPLLLAATF